VFRLESSHGAVVLVAETGARLRIQFVTEAIARVSYTEGRPFLDKPSRIVTAHDRFVEFVLTEVDDELRIATSAMAIRINRASGATTYEDAKGKLLFREPEHGGKWLTAKKLYRNVYSRDVEVSLQASIDGARAVAKPLETVFDRDVFEAKLEFVLSEDEAIFGLGSHEEGYGNLRGRSRELYQQNMKAVVPVLVSTRGYGVLFDCCSLMTFCDDANGMNWWADAVDELNFYVIGGGSFDAVTAGCHRLTGKAPMLPKWALGYVQSKERYVNARELADVVREYRRRRVPLDAVVLDWKSWPNGSGWGQKSLDPIRFPNARALTEELHAMGARLMVSIWPTMAGGCADRRELLERNLMLGNQSTYNAFSAEAREVYWRQARQGLWDKGVDAWWCDCTEPFEADWSGAVQPESHQRLLINTQQSKLYLDDGEINAYSLVHSQGIYEGQRNTGAAKRVVNLTRSAYAGQHRYSTITWNGDICGTWETLRHSIAEGVNFCATGEPYWTVDIGGFFINYDANLWFWRGDYPNGCRGLTAADALEPDAADTGSKDLGYWELYTRWLQFAAFLPMFRSHGTDAAREVWRFGDEGSPFYDTIVAFIRLRYRMLPYLYSLVAGVTREGAMMVRALALEFPEDGRTHDIATQYMLGRALMVCPVTHPMYFEAGSRKLVDTQKARDVYLPASAGWFDFWTNRYAEGGQMTLADAPLKTMPLFAKAGSILPLGAVMQYADELRDASYEVRVYCGADAEFLLYEDAGDGYDYESGAYALVPLRWNESCGELTIGARQGTFTGIVQERAYTVIFIAKTGTETHDLRYNGKPITVHTRLERSGTTR